MGLLLAGFMGATGRGTPELCGVSDKITLINSTLGKALGGACGGYTAGPKQVIMFYLLLHPDTSIPETHLKNTPP